MLNGAHLLECGVQGTEYFFLDALLEPVGRFNLFGSCVAFFLG